ncbi:hypothetical protein QJS10_CPA10g01921 [Acorus calamus]|uniref:GrpE protein homolog n=1 Tax=Acorus calamus TaxID=4465 RepID=A0AAV9E0V0_ACOCL|nr:hypothetical protein QJS10_CPA10g01921 [Acorus calamus]
MIATRILARISRSGGGATPVVGRLIAASSSRREPLLDLSNGFHSLRGSGGPTPAKWMPCQMSQFLQNPEYGVARGQCLGFSSSASPQPSEEEASQIKDEANANVEQTEDVGSDEEAELSMDELVKLVAEKEELLKMKHKEIEKMQDKVLRSYAEMENVMDRTRREAENSKKFAIQNFAKNLLDVADNLGRASSVVKDSFSKIDSSGDSVGAVSLLKTLLEGVEMTEKQLAEVFRKFGVEKYDPMDEHFDPHRHHAVFQMPSGSKPADTVAAVVKPGYMLYERVLRPAEVGVTKALDGEENQSSDG